MFALVNFICSLSRLAYRATSCCPAFQAAHHFRVSSKTETKSREFQCPFSLRKLTFVCAGNVSATACTMQATPATDFFKFLGGEYLATCKVNLGYNSAFLVHSGTFMSPANLVLERKDVPCLKPKKLLGGMFGSRAC